jgi:V/A-type H+-transporting ATPase subunit A
MPQSTEERARIVTIKGSTVEVRGLSSYRMGEITYVGEEKLIGEIIEIERDFATVQVYEPLEGMKINDPVYPTGKSLSAELGPGLLSNIFDGIQRPLEQIKKALSSSFIQRGIHINALDRYKKWQFEPNKDLTKGHLVKGGDVLGSVQETETIKCNILVPPNTNGELLSIQEKGEFKITDPIAELKGSDKKKKEITLMHEWPVRVARPFLKKLPVHEPLVTGQRIIDMFFPIAKGGTAAIPGGFGTGKCISGDTLVLLGNGKLEKIEDLYEKALNNDNFIEEDDEEETLIQLKKPLKVLSFDRENATISESKATKIYRGQCNYKVKITTKKGRSVKVTPIHKLQIFDGKKIVEKESQKLNVGDCILSPRNLSKNFKNVQSGKINLFDIKGSLRTSDISAIQGVRSLADEYTEENNISLTQLAEKLNVSKDVFNGFYYGKNNPSLSFIKRLKTLTHKTIDFTSVKAERQSEKVILPEEMNPKLAEFIGLLLSDGQIAYHKTIYFYNNDDQIRERYRSLVQELFNSETHESIKNTVKTITFYSRPVGLFLKYLNIPAEQKSRKASIPDIMQTAKDEDLIHFLNAYIAGDGYVKGYTLEISTASSKIASGLCYILSRLNIIYRKHSKIKNDHEYFRIMVEGSQLEELGHMFKLFSVTEYAKTEKIYNYANQRIEHFVSSNAIPISIQLLRDSRSLFGNIKPSEEKSKALTAIKNVSKGRKITDKTLENIIETIKSDPIIFETNKSKEIIDNLEYIKQLHSDFYFDEIKAIEMLEGNDDVYDLVVEEYHNFIGGNEPFILHNTILQHQLSKWSDADVVVYIGCGERGNEMTDVLREFPKLVDPHTKNPLMDRTLLIANVSNMPVAAREASIYMGITMAEFYRDQGFSVLLTADSTSRWAEALREIAGQLEEMPVEEGYPAYLGARLANFYERAGQVVTLGSPYREGSINITAAVSPPGGDFSEPVTANTKRFVKTFWGLDPNLANRKHFPSINWLNSYSGYIKVIEEWALESGLEDWGRYRQEMFTILQKDDELQHIAELIGSKALPADEQLIILVADIIKEGFLQQNAFDKVDSFCPIEKQMKMMKLMLLFYNRAEVLIRNGCPISLIISLKTVQILKRMKEDVPNDNIIQMNKIEDYIHTDMEELGSKYGYKV